MIGWLAPGGGDPADYRVPVIVAAMFVLVPAAMVPVMGFGAIATSSHGAGWMAIAGTLAFLGSVGTLAIVAGAAAGISAGTDEIAQASDDLSRRTEQQAASLEETAAALDELTATVRKSAEGARQASDLVTTARGEAQQSSVVVREHVPFLPCVAAGQLAGSRQPNAMRWDYTALVGFGHPAMWCQGSVITAPSDSIWRSNQRVALHHAEHSDDSSTATIIVHQLVSRPRRIARRNNHT